MAAQTAVAAHTVEPTPEQMRAHLGRFATGVTVITARDDDGPVGFACQSFASLSLDPPLVLFCVDRASRSGARVRRAETFCVNVLAADQRELCDRFGSSRGRRFEGLDHAVSERGDPMLPDVLGRVHARVDDVHEAGDHHIVIGRVLGLDRGRQAAPLLFFEGGFELSDPEGARAGQAGER